MGHFTFQAFAATPEQARDALMTAWRQHAADTGADLDCLLREDINVIEGGYGRYLPRRLAVPESRDVGRHAWQVTRARIAGRPAARPHQRQGRRSAT
jgi:hypothetical protein